MKNPIVFDLDGPLAESKSSIDADMSPLLPQYQGDWNRVFDRAATGRAATVREPV